MMRADNLETKVFSHQITSVISDEKLVVILKMWALLDHSPIIVDVIRQVRNFIPYNKYLSNKNRHWFSENIQKYFFCRSQPHNLQYNLQINIAFILVIPTLILRCFIWAFKFVLKVVTDWYTLQSFVGY